MKRKKSCLMFLLLLIILIIPTKIYAATEPTYRALLIGNGNYGPYDSLAGPYNDISKVEDMLRNNYFGTNNDTYSVINSKKDLTKIDMFYSIRETFKDAKDGDVSYIYFSGHGAFDQYNSTSYLVGVDGQGLNVHELELELRDIPGTIILMLDSCHSGGFVNKNLGITSMSDIDNNYIDEFNQSVIDTFIQRKSRSYLTTNKYKVLTSASKYEVSYEMGYTDGWGWGGEFTRAFVTGNGYSRKFLADNNNNGEVTLDELYHYTDARMNGSSVQAYPMNDSFIIGSDFGGGVGQESTTWKLFKDVSIDKTWNVKFNMILDNSSWKDNVYIIDSMKNEHPINISKTKEGNTLSVSPIYNYDYNTKYTMIINDNVISANGSKLKNKVYVPFITEEKTIYHDELCLSIVQDGYFYSHPYPSVQIAFDNFFGYPTWEYFNATDGSDVVEFNGSVLRDSIPGIITMQFTVDIFNGSFEVNYAAFDDEPLSNFEFGNLLDVVYDYYLNLRNDSDIENIFIEDSEDIILDQRKNAE